MLGILERQRAEQGPSALDPAVEDVHVPEEVHDERRRRMLEDLVRRAVLLDPALVHHHDAVGELERLFLVVGDEHAGQVDLGVQPAQPAAQLLAHLGVERAERLVEQQHLRLDRQRARQRDALPLAAGELRRDSGRRGSRAAPASSSSLTRRRISASAAAAPRRGRAGRRRRSRTPSCGGTARSAGRRSRRCARARLPLRRVRRRRTAPTPRVGDLEAGDDAQQRRLAGADGPSSASSSPSATVKLTSFERDEPAERFAKCL